MSNSVIVPHYRHDRLSATLSCEFTSFRRDATTRNRMASDSHAPVQPRQPRAATGTSR